MKIAAVTNDGHSISAHFGRANGYLVVTVENGQIIQREMRDKTACGHSHHGHEHHDHEHEHHSHGHGSQGQNISLMGSSTPASAPVDPHASATSLIADCDAVLSRGMGQGMYGNLQRAGIRTVLTKIVSIDEAVLAYVEGRLEEHPELVH